MLLYLQELKFKVNGEFKNDNVSTANSALHELTPLSDMPTCVSLRKKTLVGT